MPAESLTRLERNDGRGGRQLTTAPGLLLYGEDVAARTSPHRQPVWKLVLAVDGELVVDVPGQLRRRVSAALVPPGAAHAMAATGPYR